MKFTAGWSTVDNSGRLAVAAAKEGARTGKLSLHVQKTGGMPLDVVAQEVLLPAASTVTVTAMVKGSGCKNAWLEVWLYGSDGEPLHQEVDVVRVPVDGDWQQVEKAWPAKGAVRAVVQVVMVPGGELWIDDVVLTAAR